MMVHLTDEDLLDGPLLSIGLGAARICADWHAGSTAARWTADTPSIAITPLIRFPTATRPDSYPPAR